MSTDSLSSDDILRLDSDYNTIANPIYSSLVEDKIIEDLVILSPNSINSLACLRKLLQADDFCLKCCQEYLKGNDSNIKKGLFLLTTIDKSKLVEFKPKLEQLFEEKPDLCIYTAAAMLHVADDTEIEVKEKNLAFITSKLSFDNKNLMDNLFELGRFGSTVKQIVPHLIEMIKTQRTVNKSFTRRACFTIAQLNLDIDEAEEFLNLSDFLYKSTNSPRISRQVVLLPICSVVSGNENLYNVDTYVLGAIESFENQKDGDYPLGNNLLLTLATHVGDRLGKIKEISARKPELDLENLIFQIKRRAQ